jgi:hypothetical protein
VKKAPMTTTSFAVIDIKEGREAISKLVDGGGKVKIPITISGFIVSTISRDDGNSIEFEIQPTSHVLGHPINIKAEHALAGLNHSGREAA